MAQMSTVGIAGNVLLSAFKLIAGLAGSSGAMISDAVHSLSDVLATFIAMIGVRISKRGADADHQYGHEKFECISSEILAGILFVTGLGIGSVGVEKIIGGHYEDLAVPGMLPLVAAIVSIVSKEAMFWYTRACAKKIQSSAFMADAWHHRSDAFSSIGSLIGIVGARAGFPVLDPIASVVICLFILNAPHHLHTLFCSIRLFTANTDLSIRRKLPHHLLHCLTHSACTSIQPACFRSMFLFPPQEVLPKKSLPHQIYPAFPER